MESTRQPKEYGLLFIAAMARAAVAGIKTQTRRLPTASNSLVDGVGISAKRWADMQFDWSRAVVDKGPSPAGNPGPYLHVPAGNGETWHRIYPRYQVGDRIWGRETWAVKRHEPCLEHEREYQKLCFPVIRYLADGQEIRHQGNRQTGDGIYRGLVEKARPSTHMPRWAARIVRDITAVRVERLQDISHDDAMAEGITCSYDVIGSNCNGGSHREEYGDRYRCDGKPDEGHESAEDAYGALWESINGPGTWDKNPPVIVIEFAGVQQ